MTRQLQTWQGGFGKEYTDRNPVSWQVRQPAFQTMVSDLGLDRVLEVGCNRAHNLVALSHCLGPEKEFVGIEPNSYALEMARQSNPQFDIRRGTIYNLPFEDGYFDLAFTCTVLIHVPLENLNDALAEIHRVSQRFVLAIEYFSEEETTIHYRGHDDLLWKRNFRAHYLNQCPDLHVIKSGYWNQTDGFDRSHWWLFEKPPIPELI